MSDLKRIKNKNNKITFQRQVVKTGGEGNWTDLGNMSVACITRPETCTNGGTLMVWIKVLEDIKTITAGVLSTVGSIDGDISSGIQLVLRSQYRMYV